MQGLVDRPLGDGQPAFLAVASNLRWNLNWVLHSGKVLTLAVHQASGHLWSTLLNEHLEAQCT